MRFLRVLLWATWFAATLAVPAHAGPIVAAISALASTIASATGIFGALIRIGIGLALNIGIGLLERALQPKQKPAGVQGNIQVGGDVPRSFVLGRYATAGSLVYVNTWGSAGDTPNAYLTQVIALSDLPVSALASLFVDTSTATIDYGGEEKAWGFPVTEYQKDGKDYLWVRFHDGTQVASDSFLTSTFGDDPDKPWHGTSVGGGVAYAIVTARFNQSLFSGFPKFLFVLDGVPLYDISKDGSAGGSGAHRWADTSTWEATDNPDVMIYNILRGVSYGGSWVWGLQATAGGRLPAASWIAGINECDASVSLVGGGSEAQFRAGAEVKFSDQPIDVITELAKASNSRIAEIGGVYKILTGAPGAAVYAFTDDDIVVTDAQEYDPFPPQQNIYNGAAATYPEPGDAWANKDAPPFTDSALVTADDGNVWTASLSYSYVPYATQVQRLMQSAVLENRRFRTHKLTLPPEAWLLEPNDCVSWTSARNGYSSKLFLVTSMEGQPGYNQIVTLAEVDPADHDWTPSTDQKPVTTGPLGPIRPPAQQVSGFSAVASTVNDGTGTARRPAITVSYPGNLTDVLSVRCQVRVKATALVVYDGTVDYGAPTDAAKSAILTQGLLPATNYEVRAILVPLSGRDVTWSDWITVTTTDTRIGSQDLYPIDLATLADDVRSYQAWMAATLRALSDQVTELSLTASDQDVANWADKQQILQELSSQYGSITAAYQSAIEVATGPSSALAVSVTALQAQLGSTGGSAVFQIGTEYTPATGWTSRIGMQVRVDGADSWKDAGFFMEAKSDASRILLAADSIVMTDASGTFVNPFEFTGGTLYVQNVTLGTLKFDRLQSNDNKLDIRGDATGTYIKMSA